MTFFFTSLDLDLLFKIADDDIHILFVIPTTRFFQKILFCPLLADLVEGLCRLEILSSKYI